jgi:hypothetical protein
MYVIHLYVHLLIFCHAQDGGFVLFFEKAYYWATSSLAQRNDYLLTLWKVCQENLKVLPQTSIDLTELRFFDSDGNSYCLAMG